VSLSSLKVIPVIFSAGVAKICCCILYVLSLEETFTSRSDIGNIPFTCLDAMYAKGDRYEKRRLIGSIYPEKFTFEEWQVRTASKGRLLSFST